MRTAAVVAALCGVAVLSVIPRVAQAQFTTFTSSAAFRANFSVNAIDTFDDLTGVFLGTPLTRSAGPFHYTASTASADGFFRVDEPRPSSGSWLSTSTSSDVVVFDAVSPPVFGIGGYFFATDIDGFFVGGQTIHISASTAASVFNIDVVGNLTSGFFGVYSQDAPITSFTFTAVQTDPELFPFPTVNDLTFGTVPEPASLYLVGVGAIAMAVVSAKRRRIA